MTRLAGKIAVVTGAGRGIGHAIALRYAAEGATVVAANRNEAEGDAVVAEILAAGGQAVFRRTTFASPKSASGWSGRRRIASAVSTCCATTQV